MKNIFNSEYRLIRRKILEGINLAKIWKNQYIANPAILELFIKHYPEVLNKNTGESWQSIPPLQCAYQNNHNDSVKLLLAQPGIDVFTSIQLTGESVSGPLIRNAQENRDMLATLIKADPFSKDALIDFLKANPVSANWMLFREPNPLSALSYAVAEGCNFEVLQTLIEHGADIKDIQIKVYTPEQFVFLSQQKNFNHDAIALNSAGFTGRMEVVEQYQNTLELLRPLLKSKEELSCDDKEKLNLILRSKANIGTHIIDGKTPLEMAINAKNLTAIQILAQHGVKMSDCCITQIGSLIAQNISDEFAQYIFANTEVRLPYTKVCYKSPVLQQKYESQRLWDSIEDEITHSSLRCIQLLSPIMGFTLLRSLHNSAPIYFQALPLASSVLLYCASRQLKHVGMKSNDLKAILQSQYMSIHHAYAVATSIALSLASDKPIIKCCIALVSSVCYLSSLKNEFLALEELSHSV